MSMRNEANAGPENRAMDIFREIGLGDLFSKLILGLTATEAGATITSNVCTMANQPVYLWSVQGIGGTAGERTILRGPITGSQKITPAPGQVVWDGGKKLLFNVADANTTCALRYSTAADVTPGALSREIGQNP